ncbi:hypothetical protein [Bradyrhizobium sp. 1(2017)]|uniref:hypothetical protein n=1 Tax=Bradyrhizobium sp. 1(2017) TaxID=1404888 RepID=UPI00140F1885|nr:hypothetical protein [Bradyrhizobium sp. 1(2017)]QIO32362.1 hypothetical protein HAP40_11250 [Bradyrhizobium sp. 1(2017)]
MSSHGRNMGVKGIRRSRLAADFTWTFSPGFFDYARAAACPQAAAFVRFTNG